MKTLLDRLEDKVLIGDGCWEWTAAKDRDGYGILTHCSETRSTKAHRIVYELMVGPIPDGLQLDHLCRNRGCVRPDHLEPVTSRVNVMRGETIQAANAAKVECLNGHSFDEHGRSTGRGNQRTCRRCDRDRARLYRSRKGTTA